MYSGPEPPSLAQKGTEGHKIMTFLAWETRPLFSASEGGSDYARINIMNRRIAVRGIFVREGKL